MTRPAWMSLLPVSAALLVSTALLAACGSPASAPPPPGADLRSVALTTATLDQLAHADTAFGARLLARLQDDAAANLVLSPASIATALQMAYAGARGTTATEMASTLGIEGMTPQQAAAAASRLLDELAPLAHDKDELLSLVDGVWVQNGFRLTAAYQDMMRTGFGAALRRTDFTHGDAARRAINDAVAAQTAGKIRELITAGQITPLTRLVLTNAVHLKARWATPFQDSGTVARPFHRRDGSVVDVPMMSMNQDLAFSHGPGYKAVRLPYAGGRLAMTVVVPDEQNGPYPARLAPFTAQPVDLWLPRFRFSWSQELTAPLRAMGMRAAFDGADFSGISTEDQLHVSFVQHQAFIDVDEQGTEAAAATALGAEVGSARAPVQSVAIHADRPFYFSIDDTTTGLQLFLGKVTDPSAT